MDEADRIKLDKFMGDYKKLDDALCCIFLSNQFGQIFKKLKIAYELPKDHPDRMFQIFFTEGQFSLFQRNHGYRVDEKFYDWAKSWGLDVVLVSLFLEIPVENIIGFAFLKLKEPFVGHTYFSFNSSLGFEEKQSITLVTSDPDFQPTLTFHTASEFHAFLRKHASGFGVLLEPEVKPMVEPERKPMVEPALSCEVHPEPSDVSVPTPPSSDKFARLKGLLSKLEIKPSATGGDSP